METMRIRPATAADAPVLQALYAPYVLETPISFEVEAPGVDAFAARMQGIAAAGLPYIILECEGQILGYAYASRYHAREAYRYTVETSIYLRPEKHGRGGGSRLYASLLDSLARMGICTALACIAVPNPQSIGFHERHGFRQMAYLPRIGFKFGRWHDVAWLVKSLRDDATPGDILPFAAVLAANGECPL